MAKANSKSEDTLRARKRKLGDIMRNEPNRVTRYPILLSPLDRTTTSHPTSLRSGSMISIKKLLFIVRHLGRYLQDRSAIIPIYCGS